MSKATFHTPDDRGKLYEVIKYPAGEIQTRLTAAGIESLVKPGVSWYEIEANPIPDVIELAQLANAINGVKKFVMRSLFLPYLPYGRADRRFMAGDCDGLDVFMSLVKTMNFTIVWTFDIHNIESTTKYHILNLEPTSDIAPFEQIKAMIRELGKKGLVLVIPDEGSKNRYAWSNYGLPTLQASKKRDPKTGKLSGFKIQNEIKKYGKALIVDDICDGGGTFIGLADEILQKNPAIDLALFVSHGIFSRGIDCLLKKFDVICISDYSIRTSESTKGWKKL